MDTYDYHVKWLSVHTPISPNKHVELPFVVKKAVRGGNVGTFNLHLRIVWQIVTGMAPCLGATDTNNKLSVINSALFSVSILLFAELRLSYVVSQWNCCFQQTDKQD